LLEDQLIQCGGDVSRHRTIRAAAFLAALLTPVWALAQQPKIVAPQVLERVDAVYPPSRMAERIDTTVVLLVMVERDGSVSEATVAEAGDAAFDEAALAAVKRWRFAPAARDGQPVRARIRVPVHFAPAPPSTSPASPLPEPKPVVAPIDSRHAVAAPHAIAEPGKPIEIHVQGKPNPPKRAMSDFRLDRATLAAAPHKTAADLLSTAPGVYVSHPEGDAVAQRIYLRGFDADHGQDVELRVGGIPLNQRSHLHGQGYADLNAIIPETVRSVRVIEGVYDPEQGDFAVAGSANFDLGVEERGVQLKATYGSFGTTRLLALWAPEGQSEDTFAAAVFRTSDGFGDKTRGATSGATTGQYRFQLPDGFTGLIHLSAYAGRANLAGVLRREDVDSKRVGFYDAYPDPSAQAQSAAATRTQLGLTIARTDDDGSHQSAEIWAVFSTFRSRMNFTGYTQRSWVHPEWAGRGDLIEQSNQDLGLGGRFTYRTRTPKLTSWLTGQLTLGAEVQTDAVEQAQNLLKAPQNETWDNRVDASIHASDVGLYGDMLLRVIRYVRLRAGLRADLLVYDVDDRLGNFTPTYQEQTHLSGFRRTAAGIAWGPRVTIEGDPTRWLQLSASYGEGYRSPQGRQLEEGESAPFAKVRSYEVGARLYDGSMLRFTTAAYETRLSYDLAFDATEGRLERIGPTTRRGVVAYLQAKPTPDFMASLSGTFVHATLDSPPPRTPDNPTPPYTKGQQLPFVPPVVVRSDLSYKHSLGAILGRSVDLRMGSGVTFLASRPLPYGQQAAPVLLVDASVALRRSFLEVGVDAMNLLNAKYADTEYSFVSNWETSTVPSGLPARHLAAGAPLTVLGSITLFL
jgi:TonB family protein